MIHMIHSGLHALYRMGTYLAQAISICLQLAYVLLTLLGGFIAQLALMSQVAAWCKMSGIVPSPEVLLIGLPMDWRLGAWRLLSFFGAFVWLGYILPAQRQQDRKTLRNKHGHPYWAAGRHAWIWAALWGPIGLQFGLYRDVAAPVIAVITAGLAATYYLYVWQGLIVPRLQDWSIRERRERLHPTMARAAR